MDGGRPGEGAVLFDGEGLRGFGNLCHTRKTTRKKTAHNCSCGPFPSHPDEPKHADRLPTHSKNVELHRTFAAPTKNPELG
jgi:hypothetical protein